MTDTIRKRHEARAGYDAALASWRASSATLTPEQATSVVSGLPLACDGCRHWHGEPGSAATAPCTVKGSFRAPGGLFTEGGFWCCHWTKS